MSTRTSGGPAARRPTIREVARLAGVSHQTVSRYLQVDATVGEDLQRRIGQAIEQLDYRPNLVARAMRSRRTGRLAVLLPVGTAISSLEVLAGAQEEAHRTGWFIEVVNLDGSAPDRAQRALELADSGFFEGILALTPLPSGGRGASSSVPVVVEALYDEHMRATGDLADASVTAEIVAGLAALGHRRFVHLAGDPAHESATNRRAEFTAAVAALGLTVHAVVDCAWRAEAARDAVLALPADSGVTAVVAANDVLAVGALSGALLRGWTVPDDLSITGWDGTQVTAAMTPSLTTVTVDDRRLGRDAVRRLVAVLRGSQVPVDDAPVCAVQWRGSTGPAPTGAP